MQCASNEIISRRFNPAFDEFNTTGRFFNLGYYRDVLVDIITVKIDDNLTYNLDYSEIVNVINSTTKLYSDTFVNLLKSSNKKITIEEIQKKVAEHFNIRITDMHSPRRSRSVARPRQIAMYLAKSITSRSLPEIGRKFGGRDHTTVMHAVKK